MLVFRRLMREERDPKVRLALLCGKLEDAFATVFRQVAMTRFEEKLHAARRGEGELPIERVNELWMEANRPMFGDAVRAHRRLRLVVALHPALRPLALLLLRLRLRRAARAGAARAATTRRATPSCRATSSCCARAARTRPPALLARVGLDITDPTFWDGGLALLEELLEEAEALAGELPD